MATDETPPGPGADRSSPNSTKGVSFEGRFARKTSFGHKFAGPPINRRSLDLLLLKTSLRRYLDRTRLRAFGMFLKRVATSNHGGPCRTGGLSRRSALHRCRNETRAFSAVKAPAATPKSIGPHAALNLTKLRSLSLSSAPHAYCEEHFSGGWGNKKDHLPSDIGTGGGAASRAHLNKIKGGDRNTVQ